MDNYIESSYWTEQDWQEAKRKGDLAEDSLCRALVQMDGAILHRPFTTDAGHHIDMTTVDIAYDNYPEYQGRYLRGELDSKDECGYLLIRNIDAKYAALAPSIEVVQKGWGMFLVEWRSGCSGLCTPLSDENALTTHLALMRMEDGKPQGYHSFYLLNMADVRAFYLKYNDGSGRYIRPTRNGKYAHCALINCRKFAEEHGFVYFEYDFPQGGWQYQSIAREGWQDMPIVERTTYRMANRIDNALGVQTFRLMNNTFNTKDILLDKQVTADIFFEGNVEKMNEKVEEAVKQYDPKYTLRLPKGWKYEPAKKRGDCA